MSKPVSNKYSELSTFRATQVIPPRVEYPIKTLLGTRIIHVCTFHTPLLLDSDSDSLRLHSTLHGISG